ncbi:hypothetical protein DESUT3_03500 [Desulfuromonas versatilis]|uniref:F5/8 type C domain-containing protein n=1 Tax=Desulfuromonas versatilis TaxID=2802975 RepID=A0ABN6DVV2_9BACT|nr:hypothetical protein DESUT3_03500 [Desulfuromonas versatilis]
MANNHHDATDPNSYYSRGLCSQCHVGVTTSGDCTQCHNFGGLQNSHHQTDPALAGNCAQCHSGTSNLTNCQGCHEGKIITRHHQVAASGTTCVSCHTSIKVADQAGLSSCVNCHDRSNNAMRTRHHDLVGQASAPNCRSCHAQIVQVTNGCQSCHAPGAERADHHAAATTNNIACSQCHTSFPAGTAGSGCANCHQAGNNREFHHTTLAGDPARNLSCNSCHNQVPQLTGCDSCHQGEAATTHHQGPAQGKNCTDCHTQMVQSSSSCSSCHDFRTSNKHHDDAYIQATYGMGCNACHNPMWVVIGGIFQINRPNIDACISCHTTRLGNASIPQVHHATQQATSGDCASCHQGVTQGLDCSSCHFSLGQPATVQRHHGTAAYAAGNCATCHTGFGQNLSCSDCHSGAGGTVGERHHVNVAPAQALDCTYCHTGADTVLQACQSCHTSGTNPLFPAPVEVSQLHHMSVAYATKPCATCHTGVQAVQDADCATCHQAAAVPMKQRHHETAQAVANQCTSCHVGADVEQLNCAGCHTGSRAPSHHQQPQAVSGDCAFCHTNISMDGNGCQACHSSPVTQIHHGQPLTNVGGDCGVCHQSVSSPSVCANCHQASPHHTTTYAQTGDCAHCHKVPAWAQDRPKQAACRECHGQYQHNKGGPIQNYGSCAACHNQDTFHAAPGRAVGYTRSAPGKGKFAMFWSQYTRNGDEEVREDVSPNGEDQNDEGGRKWRNPSLSFTLKQIEHNGRTYSVPAFPDLAGTGSGGSTGGEIVSNLAKGQTASASRQESGYDAAKAVDGSTSSRWWARSTSSQWLRVNLNGTYTISKVVINWHSYYARDYQVQVSTDGSSWTTVKDHRYRSGGKEEITFSARTARYVRIYCSRAASSNGYSITELEVYK